MNKYNFLILLLFFVGLSACNSPKSLFKKGSKMETAGLNNEAADYYYQASGILKKDKKLFNLMHSWIEFSTEFNNRLNITENAMLLNQTPPNISRWRIKLKEGQTFVIIKKSI